MGSLSVAVEQREKEEKALRFFLTYSLIGSLVIHIAVLAVGSFWVKQPALAEDPPIEVMVMDSPSLEVPEPKEEAKSKDEPKAEGGPGGESGGGSPGGGSSGGSIPYTPSALSDPKIANIPAMPVETAQQPAPLLPPLQPIVSQPEIPPLKHRLLLSKSRSR